MKKINTMSALLFQLREDAEAQVNASHQASLANLIRQAAQGKFEEVLTSLEECKHFRVSPCVLDFLKEAQSIDFQPLNIHVQNVWLCNNPNDDDDGDVIVMAVIVPPEVSCKPQEAINAFLEAETTNLLKFFYTQEFHCTLGRPVRKTFPIPPNRN